MEELDNLKRELIVDEDITEENIEGLARCPEVFKDLR
jgi:hypothetical protein